MMDALESIRGRCVQPSAGVRWACLLEATAPKAGNVSPGNDFDDLTHLDFLIAAEIAAECFEDSSVSFSHGVLDACQRIATSIGTNVNLGILLLLGPLVQADVAGQNASDPEARLRRGDLHERVAGVLRSMTANDSSRLYAAINVARPGGMGESDAMDLSRPAPDDFLAAMRHAVARDRIARNYCDGFTDLFQSVVPVLDDCLGRQMNLLDGIAMAHLRLLAAEPDSLILRKFGPEVAREVQHRACFDHDDVARRNAFDRFLRAGERNVQGQISRLNPGTTADLIAAATYVLLRERTPHPHPGHPPDLT